MACIACPIFIYCRHRASGPEDNHKNISHYKQRHRPRHEIRGFSFNSSQDGKKVISIKADRFSIKKKKLGFLSFGLMNEARFDNAIIHIYGRSGQTEKTELARRCKSALSLAGQSGGVGKGLKDERPTSNIEHRMKNKRNWGREAGVPPEGRRVGRI